MRYSRRFLATTAQQPVKLGPIKYKYDVTKLYETNYLNIPVLPLPSLENTIDSYLRSVQGLVTPEQFEKTLSLAKDFVKNDGRKLHALLVKQNEETSKVGKYPYSYIEKYWDNMYLGGRWSLPVNSNPFYILQADENKQNMKQTRRASMFANATVKFWLKNIRGELEADVEIDRKNNKVIPLCMYQFSNLLGCARIPGLQRDFHQLYPFSDHIIVISKGKYYKVKVIANGKPLSAEAIEGLLGQVQAEAAKSRQDYDIGYITTQGREDVFRMRKDLLAVDPKNKEFMDVIDRSLFVLVLDDTRENSLDNLSKIALTGKDGSSRWFDKHSVIVDQNGELIVNFEHSSGDGLTWNRWSVEAWANMNNLTGDKGYQFSPFAKDDVGKEAVGPDAIEHLNFKLSDKVKQDLSNAAASFQKDIDGYGLSVLEFDSFGKNRIKEWKVSPDAAAQMSLQFAYFLTHHQPNEEFLGVPVYEACAMKNYFHGRTETIRSSTVDSIGLVKAMFLSKDKEEKKAALLKACATQNEVAKGAKSCQGPYQGVDRHLTAMRNIGEENGIKGLPFYKDYSYARSITWILSTSNVTTPFFRLFGFGPVTGNGYGIGYQTFDESLPFCITNFKGSSDGTDAKKYADNIAESLQAFDNLFK